MKELSLSLFKNQELLSIFLACVLAGLIVWSMFKFTSLKKKKNLLGITLVICFYTIISFWNLGTTNFPITWWQAQADNEKIVFEVTGDITSFERIYILGGGGDNNALSDGYQVWFNDLEIYGSNDNNQWELLGKPSNTSNYMSWIVLEGQWNYRYISLEIPSFRTVVHELGLKESGTENFLPLSLLEYSNQENSYSPTAMIDEQKTIPTVPTAFHSSYFDEIYHARNAWEIANGQIMYSSVHPLLGTSLMALGIKIFGMNPLGWRFMGALFGVLIIILFYLLAKLLFKKEKIALFSTILLACDFMVITTSRIGTLEPFSIFFILLMTYFMVHYIQTNSETPLEKKFSFLALSGISMGLAIATKWTGAYAAIALAILFFTHLFLETKATLKQIKSKENSTLLKKNLQTELLLILFWCVIFFVAIPFLIYTLSFTWTKVWRYDAWSMKNVINHSIGMFNYHSSSTATHPFQSNWYYWLFDIKPIWYFVKRTSTELTYSISCFNNPLISWGGVLSILFTSFMAWKEKSKTAFIILVGYFAALVPWMFITRSVFAYHYYPAIPFLVLSIGYMFSKLSEKSKLGKNIALIYLGLVVFIFILFLPATAGFGTTSGFLKFLQFLPSWYLGG